MPKGYGSILRILTECVPTWKLLIPTNPSFQGHFDFSFFVIQLLVSSTSMYSTAQQFFALPLLCLSYTVRTTSSILVFFATVNVKKRETYIVSASGRCVFFSNIIVIRFSKWWLELPILFPKWSGYLFPFQLRYIHYTSQIISSQRHLTLNKCA